MCQRGNKESEKITHDKLKVAKHLPQGHATTMTEIAVMIATKNRSCIVGQSVLHTIQAQKVVNESANTVGANTPAILSANAWIGAFCDIACSISWTIFAKTVSLPTALTCIVKTDNWFTVLPKTLSPIRLHTGWGYPDKVDSSI